MHLLENQDIVALQIAAMVCCPMKKSIELHYKIIMLVRLHLTRNRFQVGGRIAHTPALKAGRRPENGLPKEIDLGGLGMGPKLFPIKDWAKSIGPLTLQGAGITSVAVDVLDCGIEYCLQGLLICRQVSHPSPGKGVSQT